MSDEVIDAMAAAGCRCVELGLESGNEDTRKLYGKRFSEEVVQRVMRRCKDNDIRTAAFVILGLPEESIADMRRSLDNVERLGFDYVALNMLWIEHGAEIARHIDRKAGASLAAEAMRRINFSHPTATADEIRHLYKEGMRRFTMKPAFLVNQLLRIRSTRRVRYLMAIGKKLFLEKRKDDPNGHPQ